MAKAYNWKNFYREPIKKTTEKSIEVSDQLIKTYEGVYLYEDAWAAIGKRDNQYHFYANRMPVKMHFTSPTRFYNEEFAAIKEMLKDEKGNILGYSRLVDGKAFPNATKIGSLDTLKMKNELFGEIGWYFFDNKNYQEALAYFKQGAQVYPEDLNMLMNSAHMYLLKQDYQSALAIHNAHQKDMIRPGYSWVNLLQEDFIYLKEHGHDVKLFEKLFAELKIKKPKGY